MKRTRRTAAATVLALALPLVIGACGSGDQTTTTAQPPPISAATADRLAKLSNRVAANLEAGDTCSAAIAADDLQTAVEDADLSSSLRPGVEEVATRLVNEVNCPPPPPPPEPEKEPKKPKDEHGKGDEHGNGDDQGGDKHSGNSDHGGFVPPGQAKIKGEE